MRLAYAQRSGFVEPITAALEKQQWRLDEHRAVVVRLSEEGYDGAVIVEVDRDDDDSFGSDWEGSDETRFPARIRAAATALRDLRLYGKFDIVHEQGVLVITRLLPNS